MTESEFFEEIKAQACELVRQAGDGRRQKVALSPEVASMLESVGMDPRWPDLELEVKACTKCPLSGSRTNTVFGAGNKSAQVVFVGEAPGEQEDTQGMPFVGRAGGLLTDIIEKGMKLSRDDVFICNVLKCRPPGNRDPRPDEVEQCEPYLVRQLDIIRPKVICALGAHAAHTLLKTNESTGRMRGKWHFYHGIPVRVTYHPAYILRCEDDPAKLKSEKGKVWEDIQQVIKVLNGEVSPRQDTPNEQDAELFSEE